MRTECQRWIAGAPRLLRPAGQLNPGVSPAIKRKTVGDIY